MTLEIVRKHRAPKGALRRAVFVGGGECDAAGQKAPSAKGCIKTRGPHAVQALGVGCQKAPSAKGCIKTA